MPCRAPSGCAFTLLGVITMVRPMPRQIAACAALLGLLFTARAYCDPPAISPDGLHLVKRDGVAVVYVRPGASLKPYDKFAILECPVSFSPNWRENMQSDYDTPITDDQIHRIES